MTAATTAVLALAIAATACTTTEPDTDYVTGTWERHDAQGRVIDRLELDGAGTFTATTHYYPEVRPALFGDFSNVTGSYTDDGELIRMTGTTVDGYAFEVAFTYYADDVHFVRGAYVLTPGSDPHSSTRHYHAIHERTLDGRFTRDLVADLYVQDFGPGGSYHVAFEDPIWGTPEVDGGDWSAAADGDLMLDNTLRLQRFGTEALGQFDDFHRGIEAPATWWDTGFAYERALRVN